MPDPADKSRDHLDDAVQSPSSSAGSAPRQPGPTTVPADGDRKSAAKPVLPQRSTDETDVGWGDRASGYDDDWYLDERPPHHG